MVGRSRIGDPEQDGGSGPSTQVEAGVTVDARQLSDWLAPVGQDGAAGSSDVDLRRPIPGRRRHLQPPNRVGGVELENQADALLQAAEMWTPVGLRLPTRRLVLVDGRLGFFVVLVTVALRIERLGRDDGD